MPLSTNQEKQALIDLMGKTTLEVTPGGAAKVSDFSQILRAGCTVYVTFLQGSDFGDTMATVRRLKSEGYNPVPHFAARSIPSAQMLEESLAAVQSEGITEGLLIGGGVDKPVGEFHASIDVLRAGLFEKYGFTKLGLAGHPEGSPDISDADCALAIQQKNDYAKESAMSFYFATQFVFEAAPVLAWEKKIREQGNMLPVYVGIPGIATIKTLMRHAQHCGVGPSMRFLTRNPLDMIKLGLKDSVLGKLVNAPSSEPSELLRDLIEGINADPDCLIQQCHLYPLGGLKKSAEWMYKIQDGHFEISGKGFTTT
jgi:methylenetetrahydrofolate reductase (NADPH)